jgi:diguanylate cyclase (GGDEF)-like protein
VRPHAGDPAEADFRLGTFRAGIGPSFLASAYGIVYALWTWDRPHRTAMLLLFALVALSAVLVKTLPLEPVVRSPWREVFFLTWSSGVISLAVGVSAIDGGAASPLVVLLFLPLVFAALSYPLWSMAVVGAATIVAYVVMAIAGSNVAPADAFLFTSVLVTALWICGWQSRNHGETRRDLALASRSDPLTSVLNRRGFEERLAAALHAGEGLALLLVDLDGFKAVNDEHGHAAGDELLCWVARRLRDSVRRGDEVGRLGGDEFAVLLASGTEDAEVAAARIGAALAQRAPASTGLAVHPRDGATAEDLHRAADTALYARKRERRAASRRVPRAA